MELLFTGTSTVIPETDRDTASFLINRHTLVDCGWWVPLGMRRYGADPLAVRHLLLTHCHHDHVMALPQLLFLQRHRTSQPPLQVWGPAADVERIVELSLAFLRAQSLPIRVEAHPLSVGDTLSLDDVTVTACSSRHPVPGLCYRFDDPEGRSLVLSGDTDYNEDLIELAQGADILVHEASHGATTPEYNPALHSGGREAAQVAQAAGVKRLFLAHVADHRRHEALEAARKVFPCTEVATDGLSHCW